MGVLATPHIGAGLATFGQALPPGVAKAGIKIGALPTQTDVKNRWPDGSIRFAVLTAEVSREGDYALTEAAGDTTVFTPTWPSLTVPFAIGGASWAATLPSFTNIKPWLTGPLVSEARAIVGPTKGSKVHPLLQVVFDVRVYRDGNYRIDLGVQNVKDIPEADAVLYDVGLDLPGTSWRQADVTHWWGCRWRKTVYSKGFQPADVILDFEPFYQAKAFPRFLPTVRVERYEAEATAENPDPYGVLGFANMTPYMMTPGGAATIGPYPFWQAEYLVHKTPALRRAVLENGNQSGSWSTAVTKADGESLIRLDENKDYWLDGRTSPEWGPKGQRLPDQSIKGFRPSPAAADTQHVPSVNFVPYLMTGDRWYLDQMRFWANWGMLVTYPGDSKTGGIDFGRQQRMGLLAQNGGRGFAWPLRELADAAAYVPDDDPVKSYFTTCLINNLQWLDDYARGILRDPALPPLDALTAKGGPTEAVFWERAEPNTDAGYAKVTVWQSGYLAFAVDRARGHGFAPGAIFRDRCIRSQIKFLTSAAEGYPELYGFTDYPRVGKFIGEKLDQIVLFKTMQEIFDNNFNPKIAKPVKGQSDIIGYYGVEARLLVEMGVREKILGAVQAKAWMDAYTDPGGATIRGDAEYRPGFGVAFNAGSSTAVAPSVEVLEIA